MSYKIILMLAFSVLLINPFEGSQSIHDNNAFPNLSGGIRVQATQLPGSGYGIVKVVLFWMDGCQHCHEVLDDVLPPIQDEYGEQLEIKLIELVGAEEVDALYKLAESRGISKEKVAVPFLVIGENTLIGSQQIPAELPGLIEKYLKSGGVDWPEIPGVKLELKDATPTPSVEQIQQTSTSSVGSSDTIVHAVLFNTPGCHECDLIFRQAIAPAREKYGDKLELQTIDIVTSEDVEYLYKSAAVYNLQVEQVDLPLLIIGDSALVGEKIINNLPGMIEDYLSAGGVAYPQIPERSGAQTPQVNSSPAASPSPEPTAVPTKSAENALTTTYTPNRFLLAILVMLGMVIVLVYTGIYSIQLALYRRVVVPYIIRRLAWLLPVLALLGIAVSGYLAYVETQSVPAACGPVGDCNAVQNSPYARLFGLLPVGVLGLISYFMILVLWFVQRKTHGNSAALAGAALFILAFGGTLFSLYLTYLEPFIIKAVCIWCLTSAVTITLIMLLSLPVVNHFIYKWRNS